MLRRLSLRLSLRLLRLPFGGTVRGSSGGDRYDVRAPGARR
jgi:hypothetical protein